MADKKVSREALQSRRDRWHDLFLHYSTVRVVVLSFLLPLGGVIMVEGTSDDQRRAGVMLVGIAYALNVLFVVMSLRNLWLYRALRKWLEDKFDPILPDPKLPVRPAIELMDLVLEATIQSIIVAGSIVFPLFVLDIWHI